MDDLSQHSQVEQFDRPLTREETENLQRGVKRNIIWFVFMLVVIAFTYLYYLNWVALVIEGIAALIIFTWINSYRSRLRSGIRKVNRGFITDIVENVTFKRSGHRSYSYEAKSVTTLYIGKSLFDFDSTSGYIKQGRDKYHRKFNLGDAAYLSFTPRQKIEVSTDANGFNMESKKLTAPLNFDQLDQQEELIFHIKHKVQSNVPLLSYSPREIKMFGSPKVPLDEIFYFHVKNILIQVTKEDFSKYPVGSKITIDGSSILIKNDDNYVPLTIVEEVKS
ncbi:MAG: hypothetical protein JXQ96_11545 [Cyclobacteriaceae bacterium]